MNSIFPPHSGVEVYESSALVVQFRFPRTKKRRIRNKWRNNPANFKPDPQVYQIQGKLYAHPQTARRLKETLDKNKNTN
jgi:hypothetical protein